MESDNPVFQKDLLKTVRDEQQKLLEMFDSPLDQVAGRKAAVLYWNLERMQLEYDLYTGRQEIPGAVYNNMWFRIGEITAGLNGIHQNSWSILSTLLLKDASSSADDDPERSQRLTNFANSLGVPTQE